MEQKIIDAVIREYPESNAPFDVTGISDTSFEIYWPDFNETETINF